MVIRGSETLPIRSTTVADITEFPIATDVSQKLASVKFVKVEFCTKILVVRYSWKDIRVAMLPRIGFQSIYCLLLLIQFNF